LEDISHKITLSAGADVDFASLEDIATFLNARFKKMTAQKHLEPNWPGSNAVRELSSLAKGLFMWAKLVVDFIADGVPSEQLKHILMEKSQISGMSNLYKTLLQVSFHQPSVHVLDAFRSILGTIVLSKQGLSKKTIADLHSIDPETMSHILHKLHSVVLESSDVLRFTHQSFVDFLINPLCPEEFLIKPGREEGQLTLACLETMKHELQFNICGLESSYLMNSEVSDMDARIKNKISNHLSYSCLHWADHLGASNLEDDITIRIKDFMEVQFLFWLEVMSVTGKMDLALRSMSLARDWLKVRVSPVILHTLDLQGMASSDSQSR
jgi:hypothetical protein